MTDDEYTLPRVPLCFARSNLNKALTCGKPAGHLESDPFHKFLPGNPWTHEWLDCDTFKTPAPSPDPWLGAAPGTTLPGRTSHGAHEARPARERSGEQS